ncbi:FAD-dependent oxidoreductase [Actinomycetospora sp. TBRC 11914]|uniref:FAD-dependent oxidoreductase n=1 Tax=Actinomycetospora sp. TBRC 11914 TaxID=2729387 RepID=UPI00145DA68E|nr:FAD-dependent oxidoreductase [Actinomycetospora sp. TBRC 11914]NMO88612.1 FAD-dependent oxidoreductase [Actinomycetospora sp. TBRC 11914]
MTGPRATVVGAGIVGLAAASRLLDAGWRVTVLADRPTAASTSHLAAAVWFPTRADPRDRVLAWGAATFAELADQARRGVPGVLMRESLALYREDPGTPWWAAAVPDLRPARPDELPAGYAHGLRFAVPLVEMPVHLPWLTDDLLARGAGFVTHRLDRLDDAPSVTGGPDLVVAAPGLSARELVPDAAVVPVRGQIVRVTNPGLTLSVRDEGHPGGRAYVHPRTDDVILGGTLDEGVWDATPDPATEAAIVARCTDLVPELAHAAVLGSVAGLRPARPTVRLERGTLADGTPVVHDYGHGGSGITLSWGCADEVVRRSAGP